MTPGRAYTFPLDFTNDPYYGTVVPDNEGDVVRSRLKKATNDFYSYVTVYVITRDRPGTLAVYPATKGTSKVAYIARCLDAITATGLRVRALRLDREFYARKVIAFLTTIKVLFSIPVSQPDCCEHNVWDGAGFSFDTRHSSLTPPSSREVTL